MTNFVIPLDSVKRSENCRHNFLPPDHARAVPRTRGTCDARFRVPLPSYKTIIAQSFRFVLVCFVPGAGLEPANLLGSRILSPPCKPFHHPGIN